MPSAIGKRWRGRGQRRIAAAFADLFADAGSVVGVDGSTMNGRAESAAVLSGIFGTHQIAGSVAKVREIRRLGDVTRELTDVLRSTLLVVSEEP